MTLRVLISGRTLCLSDILLCCDNPIGRMPCGVLFTNKSIKEVAPKKQPADATGPPQTPTHSSTREIENLNKSNNSLRLTPSSKRGNKPSKKEFHRLSKDLRQRQSQHQRECQT